MTTPLSLHVEPGEHHDTLPAIQAAFELGRAEYLQRAKAEYQRAKVLAQWEAGGGMERALRALNRAIKPVGIVVGGGATLAGKVLWLVENESARTSTEIAARLGVEPQAVATCASQLFKRNKIGRDGSKYVKRERAIA